MPVFDPVQSGLILIVALMVAVAAVMLIARSRHRQPNARPLHTMSKDDSVSYFRDFTSKDSAPGVQEEDTAERWGEGLPPPR